MVLAPECWRHHSLIGFWATNKATKDLRGHPQRVYLTDRFLPELHREIAAEPTQRAALASVIRSMRPESLGYKGLTLLYEPMLSYLDGDFGGR